MSAADHAQTVIASFRSDYSDYQARHSTAIAELNSQMKWLHIHDDLRWTVLDGLSGLLGARAANLCSEDVDEQDAAISEIELWVCDNIVFGAAIVLYTDNKDIVQIAMEAHKSKTSPPIHRG